MERKQCKDQAITQLKENVRREFCSTKNKKTLTWEYILLHIRTQNARAVTKKLPNNFQHQNISALCVSILHKKTLIKLLFENQYRNQQRTKLTQCKLKYAHPRKLKRMHWHNDECLNIHWEEISLSVSYLSSTVRLPKFKKCMISGLCHGVNEIFALLGCYRV